MKQEGTAEAAEAKAAGEASQKNADALGQIGDKYKAEIEKVMAKLDDPNLSEKDRERLNAQVQELMKKQQQEAQAINAGTPKSTKVVEEGEKLENEIKGLKARVRTLILTLDGNVGPEWCSGEISGPVRSGTLKGHPLYRYSKTTSYAPTDRVCLAVLLGPAGFKNPPQTKAGEMRAELKTILVKAKIESFRQSVKADEATARQMLEKVDYDALSKLLTP